MKNPYKTIIVIIIIIIFFLSFCRPTKFETAFQDLGHFSSLKKKEPLKSRAVKREKGNLGRKKVGNLAVKKGMVTDWSL